MDTSHFLPVSHCVDSGDMGFYYPFGNTPAEDFLVNLLPGSVEKPEILVLGCGDIRSCFYTLWKHFMLTCGPETSPSFSGVHFVLNDHSAAILARNIILLHLCIQRPLDIHSANFNKWLCALWAIWFSRRLLPEHEKKLNSSLKCLLQLSVNMKSWTSQENPLNSLVHFSSESTLSKIHDTFKMWLTHSFIEKKVAHISIPMSKNTDLENLLGVAVNESMSSKEREKMRSEIKRCSDGDSFAEYVVGSGQVLDVMKLVANVTMHARADGKFFMDSLLPFRCFHNAFRFSSRQLHTSCTDHEVLDKLVIQDEMFEDYPLLANCVQQFSLWLSCASVLAPESSSSAGHKQACVQFTFHCSDAIEFCNELQSSVHIYSAVPERFDTVFTSNLVDPLYPPNVVLFSIPLLKPNGYLFTTALKYRLHARTTHEYISDTFGIDNKMFSILFGIRCINHEGDDYRACVSIRPAPVEANAMYPGFTPYYVKVIAWNKVPPMIIPTIQPDSFQLWYVLYSTISTILSVPPDGMSVSTTQTAVKMLQMFKTNVNADDSDGKFWNPLCSLLRNSYQINHLLDALQTHSLLSGLHLHLLVTDKFCPLCNKISLSKVYGRFCISVKPLTQSGFVNIFAQVHKSEEKYNYEYSTFDCMASQNHSDGLILSFIAPLSLCESGHTVSVVTYKVIENEIRSPPTVLTTQPLKTCLSGTITHSFPMSEPQRSPPSTSLGHLKSHCGNGDRFETVLSLSADGYREYSYSKRFVLKRCHHQ